MQTIRYYRRLNRSNESDQKAWIALRDKGEMPKTDDGRDFPADGPDDVYTDYGWNAFEECDAYMRGDRDDIDALTIEMFRDTTINEECKRRLKSAGITQADAASEIGATTGQLNGWLNGCNSMSEGRIKAIVEFLGGEYVSAHAEWPD